MQFVRQYEANLPRALADQLIQTGTAIGAHVAEANAAHSRRNALSQLTSARKNSLEIGYWLKLAAAADLADQSVITPFLEEAHSLHTDLTALCVKARTQLDAEKG